ncbi:MAG: dihydrofolate reductase [Bacteroidetes bacterium]|nr:dihydrofolate reductase [Bacteroidota bacterium]
MRKLLLNLAVTLDGYIEGPNGEIDWCLADQDYGLTDFLARCDALLMGRKSYEGMLVYDPNPWPEKRKYVFSRTLREVIPHTDVLAGEVAQEVARLKALPGQDIWLFGGADLIAQCLQAGLVDELCLAVHPLLLGGGRPLFIPGLPRVPLRMLDTRTYDTGLVQVTYAVVR